MCCGRYIRLNEMAQHLKMTGNWKCKEKYDEDKIEFFNSFAKENPPE